MDHLPKNSEREMSAVDAPVFNSTDRAHALVKDIAGHAWRGRGDMVDRVFDVVTHAFPKSPWTRRRVRALWHREAARIDWREVRELEFVAEVERAKRLEQEAARAKHNEFVTHISNTLDRMEANDAEFFIQHRAALRALAFGSADFQIREVAGESSEDPSSSRQVRALDRARDFNQQ
ncbi:hypothetical protein [Tianweitania sediminis]|uniref:Uncharacterized protein n=1 Tax=Tianweitania sediminis TaxID=1502156 RepID=A0A8J7R2X4_9HYPH|nr:hypothetical protein [Tianweitania sediminis]MBP0440657.1 hypothetical protein [Tianweitania sediminis]